MLAFIAVMKTQKYHSDSFFLYIVLWNPNTFLICSYLNWGSRNHLTLLPSSGHKESIYHGRSGWNIIFFLKQILLFWKDFPVAVHNFILKARIGKWHILVRLPDSSVIQKSAMY